MKKYILILVLIGGIKAQSQNLLGDFIATSAGPVTEEAQEKLKTFVHSIKLQDESDQVIIRKTFRQLHSRYLKTYQAYAGFHEIFSTGKYDCLTATALFSYVLAELNYPFEVVETNYHIFLLVRTQDGRILLETTDRFGGFVTDEKKISARISNYQKSSPVVASGQPYHYSFNLCRSVPKEKLTGLLYFNRAVASYNQHEWLESAILLDRAHQVYATERCEELGAILLQTVLETPMMESTRNECLSHLGNFWIKRSALFASN